MKEDKALAFLSGAQRLVDKCRTVADCKEVADKAAAVAFWAKRAGKSLELVNEAQEYRITAERKGGELLKAMEKAKGGNPNLTRNKSLRVATLKDMGVAPMQSSRWQAQASVPEPEFQKWKETTKAKGEELSSNALRKVAKERGRKEKIEEIKTRAAKEPTEGVLGSLKDGAGQFRCIYLDPPWAYGDENCRGAAEGHYPTMSLKQLAALPVGALAHKEGCHLWLWTTWPMIRDNAPHVVLDEWDCRWVGEFVWKKPGFGVGRWLRPATEILILAVHGDLKLQSAGKETNAFREAPRGKHSEKPEEFYDVIEALSPGPRVELFARQGREGWMRWGLEA
jgi:N6-adenosine-specific RNA methylase IME4